jgi:two-component system, OmpR family, sensor kinase
VITRSIRFQMALWYAALLAGALALFGAATYLGLQRYLQKSLEESLTKQARSIGDVLIVNINQSGEDYVDNEITEHYSPEINGRFVRVTRADGKRIYVSGTPKDRTFDPALVAAPRLPAAHEFSREVKMSDGHELLLHGLPYRASDGTQFIIEVAAPYNQIESVLRGLLLTFALGLPLIVALAIGGGYVLMRRALRPVDEIRQKAARITSRNLSERLPVVHTGDELERLAIDLNQMIERLEESFHQINRFSADASHELRTPLTVLQGELEAIAEKGRSLPDDVKDTIGSALEETQRLARIVESLLAISRLEAGEARVQPMCLDFAELVRITAEQMKLLAEEKHISMTCDETIPVDVEADPSRLKQVVVNLLDNAIKYTPQGGSVSISVTRGDDRAILEVADSGLGISADDLPHVFERFYRADKARSRQMGGTGLGLSIVRSICQAHGGRVTVNSGEGRGSIFRVELPVSTNNRSQSRIS